MEFLKDMDEKGQSIRQDEINGKQHQFHSLPKEFQAWHNTQYMMEKKVFIDESTIPESLLNGYMWKAIGDGSNFGITTFFAIAFSIIKLKLAPNFWGLFISLIIFMPWLAYVVYHIIFYAKIRAQVVGKVTENGYRYTSKIYYETFYSIVISMCIALLFIFSILDDIVVVLRDMIVSLSPESIYEGYLKTFLIWIYNFFIDLLSEPKDLFGKILFNTYFSTFIFLGLTLFIPYVFEKQIYRERRIIVDQEMENEESLSGYAMDNAIRKITKWREENNV